MSNIQKALARWFESSHRVLPWRTDPSPYRVWISEIMLQQTQVKTVLPYFERFIQIFPSVEILAKSKINTVLKNWEGLGYYRRARSLHEAAKIIVKSNRFPSDQKQWLEIPGVGPYTAGAIASIALNQVAPILDGNVERVLSRVFRVGPRSDRKDTLWSLSQDWVQKAHDKKIKPSVTNQALMELGAMVCTPKNPKCESCPISFNCLAFQNKDVLSYPPKKIRPKSIKVDEVRYLIKIGPWYWIEPNLEKNWKKGLWDLPACLPASIQKTANQSKTQIHTKHSITKYRFNRTTKVLELARAQRPTLGGAGKWVKRGLERVPLGGPLKKVLNCPTLVVLEQAEI